MAVNGAFFVKAVSPCALPTGPRWGAPVWGPLGASKSGGFGRGLRGREESTLSQHRLDAVSGYAAHDVPAQSTTNRAGIA